jgi:hypothetical protein
MTHDLAGYTSALMHQSAAAHSWSTVLLLVCRVADQCFDELTNHIENQGQRK